MRSTEAPGFDGYLRPDGKVGVRNLVLVLSINGLSNRAAQRIAEAVKGATLVATPYGRGQYGEDKALHLRQVVGLGCNPNVATVLVIGVDRPTADDIAEAIAASGRAVDVATLDDTHENALELSARGIRIAGRLVREASALRRTPQPLSALTVGVECGHSDATSGIVANPVAGACVDRLVDLGATAIVGETVEWLGAEEIVARRAATPEVGAAILAAVLGRERRLAAASVNLTGNNPGAENIRGGLSTIEEKSLGAIAKTGSRPILSVLAHGEPPAGPGLHLMDGPSFSPESLTGFAAAGAQLTLFTTGPGNSFCSLLAPTLKITGRRDTAERLGDQIDFDAGDVLAGHESIDSAADRLLARVIATASGDLTWGEIHGEGAECFTRLGPSM